MIDPSRWSNRFQTPPHASRRRNSDGAAIPLFGIDGDPGDLFADAPPPRDSGGFVWDERPLDAYDRESVRELREAVAVATDRPLVTGSVVSRLRWRLSSKTQKRRILTTVAALAGATLGLIIGLIG